MLTVVIFRTQQTIRVAFSSDYFFAFAHSENNEGPFSNRRRLYLDENNEYVPVSYGNIHQFVVIGAYYFGHVQYTVLNMSGTDFKST